MMHRSINLFFLIFVFSIGNAFSQEASSSPKRYSNPKAKTDKTLPITVMEVPKTLLSSEGEAPESGKFKLRSTLGSEIENVKFLVTLTKDNAVAPPKKNQELYTEALDEISNLMSGKNSSLIWLDENSVLHFKSHLLSVLFATVSPEGTTNYEDLDDKKKQELFSEQFANHTIKLQLYAQAQDLSVEPENPENLFATEETPTYFGVTLEGKPITENATEFALQQKIYKLLQGTDLKDLSDLSVDGAGKLTQSKKTVSLSFFTLSTGQVNPLKDLNKIPFSLKFRRHAKEVLIVQRTLEKKREEILATAQKPLDEAAALLSDASKVEKKARLKQLDSADQFLDSALALIQNYGKEDASYKNHIASVNSLRSQISAAREKTLYPDPIQLASTCKGYTLQQDSRNLWSLRSADQILMEFSAAPTLYPCRGEAIAILGYPAISENYPNREKVELTEGASDRTLQQVAQRPQEPVLVAFQNSTLKLIHSEPEQTYFVGQPVTIHASLEGFGFSLAKVDAYFHEFPFDGSFFRQRMAAPASFEKDYAFVLGANKRVEVRKLTPEGEKLLATLSGFSPYASILSQGQFLFVASEVKPSSSLKLTGIDADKLETLRDSPTVFILNENGLQLVAESGNKVRYRSVSLQRDGKHVLLVPENEDPLYFWESTLDGTKVATRLKAYPACDRNFQLSLEGTGIVVRALGSEKGLGLFEGLSSVACFGKTLAMVTQRLNTAEEVSFTPMTLTPENPFRPISLDQLKKPNVENILVLIREEKIVLATQVTNGFHVESLQELDSKLPATQLTLSGPVGLTVVLDEAANWVDIETLGDDSGYALWNSQRDTESLLFYKGRLLAKLHSVHGSSLAGEALSVIADDLKKTQSLKVTIPQERKSLTSVSAEDLAQSEKHRLFAFEKGELVAVDHSNTQKDAEYISAVITNGKSQRVWIGGNKNYTLAIPIGTEGVKPIGYSDLPEAHNGWKRQKPSPAEKAAQ